MGVLNFANREVCELIICDFATKKPVLNLDYANTTAQELTGEQVYAYGGWGHPRRVTFYGEKGGTFTVSTQIMSAELFALMTGAEITSTAKWLKRLELTAADGTMTVPEGITLADGSLTVYTADDDMGTPVEGVNIAGQTITLTEGGDGAYVVYGIQEIDGGVKKMSITSKTFPKAVTIYGETIIKAEDDTTYPYRLIVYKASPQQQFNFSFSNNGDPVTLELTFDILADQDGNMVDMLLMEEEME